LADHASLHRQRIALVVEHGAKAAAGIDAEDAVPEILLARA